MVDMVAGKPFCSRHRKNYPIWEVIVRLSCHQSKGWIERRSDIASRRFSTAHISAPASECSSAHLPSLPLNPFTFVAVMAIDWMSPAVLLKTQSTFSISTSCVCEAIIDIDLLQWSLTISHIGQLDATVLSGSSVSNSNGLSLEDDGLSVGRWSYVPLNQAC